jgi:hypothetical protein
MVWKSITEWRQKRTLQKMLTDPRSLRGSRAIGQRTKASVPIERRLNAFYAAWAPGNPKAGTTGL